MGCVAGKSATSTLYSDITRSVSGTSAQYASSCGNKMASITPTHQRKENSFVGCTSASSYPHSSSDSSGWAQASGDRSLAAMAALHDLPNARCPATPCSSPAAEHGRRRIVGSPDPRRAADGSFLRFSGGCSSGSSFSRMLTRRCSWSSMVAQPRSDHRASGLAGRCRCQRRWGYRTRKQPGGEPDVVRRV